MEINAVTYARFSSNNQREASIEIQQENIYRYCKDNGITIIKDYVDRALSATSDNRPQFLQMIKDAESGQFSFVVVYNSSRFCRNIQDHLKYKSILESYGVKIICVNENFDESTPEGDLMSNFMMSINQYYSKDLSRKVFLGCMESARNAKHVGGKTIYGYDLVNQQYVINEKEAEAVRLIFNMTAKEYTNKEICDELNRRGLTKRDGSKFQAKFSGMLRNRKYIGEFVWNQYKRNKRTGKLSPKAPDEVIRIPNAFPALVSEELFNKVQKIIDKRGLKNTSKAKTVYLLQSMITCGCCGYTVSVDCDRNANGKHTRIRLDYRCYSKNRRRLDCNVKPYRVEFTDTYILNLLNNVLLNERYAKAIYKTIVKKIGIDYENIREVLFVNQQEMAKIKRKIKELVSTLPDAKPIAYQGTLIEIEKQKVMLSMLQEQSNSMNNELEQPIHFNEETILNRILALKKEMGTKTVNEIKDVLRVLIKDIKMTNEEFIVNVNLTAYLPKTCKRNIDISIVEEAINIKNRNYHFNQKLNWSSLDIRF